MENKIIDIEKMIFSKQNFLDEIGKFFTLTSYENCEYSDLCINGKQFLEGEKAVELWKIIEQPTENKKFRGKTYNLFTVIKNVFLLSKKFTRKPIENLNIISDENIADRLYIYLIDDLERERFWCIDFKNKVIADVKHFSIINGLLFNEK